MAVTRLRARLLRRDEPVTMRLHTKDRVRVYEDLFCCRIRREAS